jgi:hypothetical protein
MPFYIYSGPNPSTQGQTAFNEEGTHARSVPGGS